jgi:hypothetical protein
VRNQTSTADGIEPGPGGLLYYDTNEGETVMIERLRTDGTYQSPIRLNSTLSLTFAAFDVDSKGDVFVLTTGLVPGQPDSVWKVSPSGSSTKRLLRIAVAHHKTPPHQGSGMSDIAVDPSGHHLYLSNIDHHRVDEYKL